MPHSTKSHMVLCLLLTNEPVRFKHCTWSTLSQCGEVSLLSRPARGFWCCPSQHILIWLLGSLHTDWPHPEGAACTLVVIVDISIADSAKPQVDAFPHCSLTEYNKCIPTCTVLAGHATKQNSIKSGKLHYQLNKKRNSWLPASSWNIISYYNNPDH